MKFFNIIIALILLIVLSPLFIIVSLLILILDGKPIFYTQERVGKDKRIFKIFKFRTMVNNADELKNQLLSENEATFPFFKIREDKRITKIGKILRKTSIDELPQLINVIKGDMSFVGVRPILKEEMPYLSEERFLVNAGMTGPTQILRGEKLTLDEINEVESKYAKNKNILNDLKIVFKTFLVIFKGV